MRRRNDRRATWGENWKKTRSFYAVSSPNVRQSGFRIKRNFCLWNLEPGLWNPEYSQRNPESHNGLKPGIQVPLTKDPESSTWNLESTAWNPVQFIKTVLDWLTWGKYWVPADGSRTFDLMALPWLKYLGLKGQATVITAKLICGKAASGFEKARVRRSESWV